MTLVDSGSRPVAGPFFEDLAVGDVFDEAPALTLTEGHAAVHQAVVGDRLRIALDGRLSHAVARAPIAHPALVCDVAIGQSTLATQRVVANLFYRGLVLRRAPAIGDTLYTRTEIVALRRNRSAWASSRVIQRQRDGHDKSHKPKCRIGSSRPAPISGRVLPKRGPQRSPRSRTWHRFMRA